MRGNEFLDKMELVSSAYVEAADKTPRFKTRSWVKYGLVAACLCAALLVSYFAIPNEHNVFVVKACALDIAEDGSVRVTETDFLDQPDVLGGYMYEHNFYLNVGLKYDGENIKSVTFSTEYGFLAIQDISKIAPDAPRMYVGSNNRLVVCGTDFENCGSSITFDADSPMDNLLLFWGIDFRDSTFDEAPEIIATATFNDGKTQTITIPIKTGNYGLITGFGPETFSEYPEFFASWSNIMKAELKENVDN